MHDCKLFYKREIAGIFLAALFAASLVSIQWLFNGKYVTK
jgi:hypothetical protein